MNTSVNTNNIESNNGMSQVVIDLRPEVKHHEGYGREKVADVYFRTQVRAYSRQVYGDYSQEAHEAAEKATAAYYSEVVELLKTEGWTLLNENYAKWHNCPELANGAQYLYVHPDSISGEVNPADIDALEAKFKALTACEYRWTDNYGDIVLTRSEADERMLYRETYTEGIADTIKECTTTKRSNLYKDRGDALGCIRNRIAIQNKRTDLTGHGTGYYRERKAVAGFVQEEYDRLLQAGYIKEVTGQNGRTLCRWISKKEEKELTKARREAEKAEKERKAQEWQEFLDREAEKQNSFAEGMRVKVPAASLERNRDKEAFVITRIRRKAADNGGNASLTVKSELTGIEKDINGSDVSEILPALQEASEITEQREQNDACISSAESRRDKANGQITDGAKKESFGKMFIYRLYIKWKWMQQRFERIGDMDRAAYCFYHRLRLTKLYIYQPGWRIMDYGDMKPIFFPRQRIK